MNTYYKILPQNLKCRGFQYHEGLNVDINKIDAEECSYGLHFADAKHILMFYGYGTIIAEVEIPEDAVVYHFDDKSKADRIILKNLRPLWTIETIEALIQKSVNFESYKGEMIYEALSCYYPDVAKYLIEHGTNTSETYAYALSGACGFCHLDIVKCLVEHGTDIHNEDEYALRRASRNGYLDIVKYLVEQSADIHIYDDIPLRSASEHGYLNVVKYLVEQGANIHACDNYAIEFAGTEEIKEYLKSLK